MINELEDLGLHEGYAGVFTRNEAEGAYPNGTRIKKVFQFPTDGTPLGTLGTVLGSISDPQEGVAYFVEWDSHPRMAVLVTALKIGLESDPLRGFLDPGGTYDPYAVKVGQEVMRIEPGNNRSIIQVTDISDDKVFCGSLEFDRHTGVEVDEEHGWGPQNGLATSAIWTKWTE